MSSEPHFANAHLQVVTDHVRTPSRSVPRTWTIVHRKAAVIIAPVTRTAKSFSFVRNASPFAQQFGKCRRVRLTAPPETAEQVALRELREEAGYELAKDGHLVALGYYFTSPGFTDERGHFFLARPVESSPNYVRDESESILDCRTFTVPEIRMIAETKIVMPIPSVCGRDCLRATSFQLKSINRL